MTIENDKQPNNIEELSAKALDNSALSSVSGGRAPSYSGGCTGCMACVEVCPTGAITISNGVPSISQNCVECGTCIYLCPAEALKPSF